MLWCIVFWKDLFIYSLFVHSDKYRWSKVIGSKGSYIFKCVDIHYQDMSTEVGPQEEYESAHFLSFLKH